MNKRSHFVLAVILSWLCAVIGAQAMAPAIYPQLAHTLTFAIAFSPSGNLLASGDADGSVTLWDVASGRELRRLANAHGVSSWLTFSPDGMKLLGLVGGQIEEWDIGTGKLVLAIGMNLQLDSAHSASLSPDGKILALGTASHGIQLLDASTGHNIGHLDGQKSAITALAFSPDGKTIASGEEDATIQLWDVAAARATAVSSAEKKAITSLVFSRDGRMFAAATDQGVNLRDVRSGRVLYSFSTDFVSSLSTSADGKLAASSRTGVAKIWDMKSGTALRTLNLKGSYPAPIPAFLPISFSPDGRSLATATIPPNGGDIKIWDIGSYQPSRTLEGSALSVSAVAASSDGKLVAAGYENGTIVLWTKSTGRQALQIAGHRGRVVSLFFLAKGKELLSAGSEGKIILWDTVGGNELKTLVEGGQESLIGGTYYPLINSLSLSRDERMVASGCSDGLVRVWDIAAGRTTHEWKDPLVASVSFSANGKTLAAAANDNSIKFWDVASGRALPAITGEPPIAYSPDGNLLLASGWAPAPGAPTNLVPAVKLLDPTTGRGDRTVEGNGAAVFSRDGSVFATVSANKIQLWNAKSASAVKSFAAPDGEITSMAFSADGTSIVSGGSDGTVRLWDIATGRDRVALVSFTDGSSIAITPEGFFDSSSVEAEKNINVRVGSRVLSMASYREAFYRPDLVQQSLNGQNIARAGNISEGKLPPFASLVEVPSSTDRADIQVKLKLTDGGGGIGKVRLFLNGASILQDSQAASGDDLTRSYTVQLLAGDNVLSAVALNADGDVQSNETTAFINAKFQPPPRTLHAIIVGIQDFKIPGFQLKNSLADAQLFADTLRRESQPLFANLDIKELTAGPQTSTTSLKHALQQMRSTTRPDDVFVFYIATHGGANGGQYYFLTSDVSSQNTLKSEALSGRELADLLADIPATKKLLIIDACQSGALGNPLQQTLANKGMNLGTATTVISRGTGLTVLAASATDQQAQEGYHSHGLFTYVLVNGLTGADSSLGHALVDPDGTVSTASLADYVDAKVPPLATAQFPNNPQTPMVSKSGQPFPIAKAR